MIRSTHTDAEHDMPNADDVRARLHLLSLPEATPPDALWERLQQAHLAQIEMQQARTRQRAPHVTRRVAPWLATAAALVVAVLAVQVLRTPLPGDDAPLASTPVAQSLQMDAAGRASLLRIDAELARAYEVGADDARLDALRQSRSGVVDSFATAAPAELVQL